tara:strand:- start:493 stop:603 length:111 start_codon:yes stop_codon:yes gene_type:complete
VVAEVVVMVVAMPQTAVQVEEEVELHLLLVQAILHQ